MLQGAAVMSDNKQILLRVYSTDLRVPSTGRCPRLVRLPFGQTFEEMTARKYIQEV